MSKGIGEIAELRFALAASELGIRVSDHKGENRPYDLITEHNGRCLKVQVKATDTFSSTPAGGRYKLTVVQGNDKRPYEPHEVDVVACYVGDGQETWYIIPLEALRSPSACLYPHRDNPKGYYEQYKEKWEILYGPKQS